MKQAALERSEYHNSVVVILVMFVVALIALTIVTSGSVFSSSGAQTLAPQTIAQEAKPADVRELKLGAPIERELAGGDAHSYRITLTAGQYLHVVVEQKGIDVVVRLSGTAGQKITEVDSPNGTQGPEPVSVIADAAGAYRLEVEALGKKGVLGRYEVKVEVLRESTATDRDRIAAERAIVEAEQLRIQRTAESQRKAIEKYNEALPLLRKVGDRQEEAKRLNQIGVIYLQLGDGQKGLEYFNQALSLWRALGNRREEATTLHNIGSVYWQLGDSQKALEYFTQVLQVWRAVGYPRGEAQTLSGIGTALDNLGKLQEALNYYSQALALQRSLGNRREEATTLTNIGTTYLGLGELQKALEYLSKALALQRITGDRRVEAATLSHIGVIYWQLGEHQKALEYYNQALALKRETGDRHGEFSVLQNIGVVYRSLSESQKALEYHNQALALARAIGDRRGEAVTLQNIGVVYMLLGDLQKAPEYLNQALLLLRAIGDLRQEAITLSQIGVTHSLLGKPEEALNYLELALSLHRAVGDRSSEAKTLQSIARAERDRGRFDEARAQIEAALNIVESTRSQLVSQELRTSFSASRQEFYELYMDLLMQKHRSQPSAAYDAAALQVSERARARSLLEILTEARTDIRQGVDPVLLERERSLQLQLNAKSERLTRLLSGKHTEEQETAARKEVEALLTDYQDVAVQIRAKSPRYAALTQPQPLSVKEIQQVLDKDTLLLEYALSEERSYLWAVTPTSIKSFELPRRVEIETAARRVYELLVTKADALYPEALTSLSQMLLGPVADQLGRKRLLIVSQGALQYVPFGALPAPSVSASARRRVTSTPLVLNHEIVSLPSASVMAVLRRELSNRKAAPKKVVVLADPVFVKDDQRVKPIIERPPMKGRNGGEKDNGGRSLPSDVERSATDLNLTSFDRLPVSRSEADIITAMVPRAQALKALDFAASRATATSPQMGQYQIVHFATHSLLNNQHPELSGIVLSLVDEQGQQQDGFLRLHDIYNLNLEADLVVLSACQTALGKEIKGEGLVGLTRGFMYAGTPRVVASLWKVGDKATAELMKRFYQNVITDGMRPAAALRAAQVSMSKEKQWAAPYYWAGFVLQGEWR